MIIYVVFECTRDNAFFVGAFDSYQKAHYIVNQLKQSKSEFSASVYSIREMNLNEILPLYQNVLEYSD